MKQSLQALIHFLQELIHLLALLTAISLFAIGVDILRDMWRRNHRNGR